MNAPTAASSPSGTGTGGGVRGSSEKKRKADDDTTSSSDAAAAKRACPEAGAMIVTPPQSKAALAARRQAEFYADKPLSLSDLAHGLIMDQIFSYLDSRALYRVACLTSKSLSQFVTTKHVVYSAATSGGSARESLSRIVHLLKREAIHAPSRLRLLRILNGVACERGADCVQHGIRRRKMMEAAAAAAANKSRSKSKAKAKPPATITPPKIRGVQIVRKDFGLFICNDCAEVWNPKKNKHKKTPSDQDQDKGLEEGDADGSEVPQHATVKVGEGGIPWFTKHKRLAARKQGRTVPPVVLRNPFTDSAKEVAGPVLTYADFLEFKDKGKEADIQKKLKALDDQALQNGFPSASIITYHKEALELFEKRKRARESESQVRRTALYNKRAKDFEKVVMRQLEARLEGAAWKSVALSYALQGNAHKYARSSSVATFKCPIVQEIMKEFTIVPSKFADGNNLSVKVAEITQAFNAIWSAGFHDLSFLDAPADSGDVLCLDLRDFYKKRLKTTPEYLLLHERMHPDVLRLIRSGQCLEALYRRFQAENTVGILWVPEDAANQPLAWQTRAWCKQTVPRGHTTTSFFIYAAWSKEQGNLGQVPQHHAVRMFYDACYFPYKHLSSKKGAELTQLWTNHHSNALRKVHEALVRANP